MRNLIITAILTVGLLLPGVSFAGDYVFGVNTDSLRSEVNHNIENPSYTADELSIKTESQNLQNEKRGINDKNYNIADYFFGVEVDSEDIS